MQITIVSNNKGKMCKTYNKDLTKDGSSQLYEGGFKVLELESLEQIGDIKKKLKNNQAIILGIPIENNTEGKIYSRSNFKGHGITRTKDMFTNEDGIIMFDFDLREYGNITLDEYRDMLIKCDPQLKNCEMFLTYGSSAGISNKKDKTGWGSIHAYCRINKEIYIKSYSEALFNNGLNLGFGEIKVNEKVFRGYINGIIDLAVLKGDASRIIYEAAPILHKKLIRKTRDDLYYSGGVIIGSQIIKTGLNTSYQNKINNIIENLKKKYKSTSKEKKEIISRKLDRTNEIYGSEDLILNDGSKIKAREILVGNYTEISMRDPFEPEKGMNKAKVFESLDLTKRPAMHSFVHGGQMYYFHCDLKSIPFLVENLEEEDIFTIVKRDFKGYMLDKAVNVLVDTMDKTRGAIKKYLKESDYSKVQDLVCNEEGFSEEEDIGTEQSQALHRLSNTFFIRENKSPLYGEIVNGNVIYGTPSKMRELYSPFDTKDENFFHAWASNGDLRNEVMGFRFNPSETSNEVTSDGYYNLWQGFRADPIEGDLDPFIHFTKVIICNNDEDKFTYLMDYLANMVQNPGNKEGVAIVLRGKKGAGKDTWIHAVAGLFPENCYTPVNSIKDITSNFNINLQGNIIANIGEAFFSGDHGAKAALKTLITEDKRRYEPKGVDAFTDVNYTRVFMSSNDDWVVPAEGKDERRFFVLDVNNDYMRNRDYMGKFKIWKKTKAAKSAILYYLMEREITSTLFYAPETEALVEQKKHGLRGVEKWLYDCAYSNILLGSSFETDFFKVDHSSHDLFMAYKASTRDEFISNEGVNKKISQITGSHSKVVKRSGKVFRVKSFKKKNFIKNFINFTGITIELL